MNDIVTFDELTLRRKIDLMLRTGKLLMESNATTNLTQECMAALASAMEIPTDMIHIDVRFTMLIVNVSDVRQSFCKFQKIERHVINMSAISRLTNLVDAFCASPTGLDEFEDELQRLERSGRNFTHVITALGAGFACGGFCKLFGGDWAAFAITSVCAFVGFLSRAALNKQKLNVYFSTAIAALLSTCLAILASVICRQRGITETPFHPMLACALFIVPGVPLINFVDDMVDNQLLVGLTRFANTMMLVGAMTFGISAAMVIARWNAEIPEIIRTLSTYPGDDSYLDCALAAAIAAMGFSMIFNIEKRWLPIVAMGGIIAVLTRNFCNYSLELGPVIGSFVGSLTASSISVAVCRKLSIPNHVISIPSVIPMIPGVMMYRALLNIADVENITITLPDAFNYGFTSALVILCISLGVAFPSILMRMHQNDKYPLRCF